MIKKILVVFVVLLLLTLRVCADEKSIEKDIYERSGAGSLKAPPEISNFIGDLDSGNVMEKSNADEIGRNLSDFFFGTFKAEVKAFFSFFAFLILLGLMALLKKSFDESEISPVFEYASLLCLAMLSYSFLGGAFENAIAYLERSMEFMSAMLPVMATLFALGGNAAAAVAQSSSLVIVLCVLQVLTTTVLAPLLKTSVAITIVGSVSGVNISGINRAIKKITTWGCLFFFTLLSAIMYFQTLLAGSADSVAMRGVRFAAGSFIPIVGGLVSEAASVVTGGVGVIRGTVGLFGVIVILYLTVMPIISILVKKLLFSFFIFVANLFSLDKEASFLEEISGILNIMTALTISSGVYFLIAMALFMRCWTL